LRSRLEMPDMVVLVVIVGVIAIAALLSAAMALYTSRKPDALEQLGVRSSYPWPGLPKARIDAYFELKEQLRSKYAGNTQVHEQPGQPGWMSRMPAQAKDMLKYRLMQRAVGDMSALRKIDGDARGYWRLFTKGIITTQFWESVQKAEQELSKELEAVKMEALGVEPLQNPQGILSEAMQFLLRFGDDVVPSPQGTGEDPIDMLLDKLPAQGKAVSQQHPPMPSHPSMPHLPPGMQLPPGMAMPGQHPGPAQPPLPPPGSEKEVVGDTYSWRQDPDEVEVSVSVPNNTVKKDIKVTFQANYFKVESAGAVVTEGRLPTRICPEGCTWTLAKGRVVCSLEKAEQRAWPALYVDSDKQ